MQPKYIWLLVFVAFIPQYASAYNFTLSQQEFNTWDTRCKALYVWTQVGRKSDYVNQVSPDLVKYYKDKDKEGAWHYCAGLIYLQRAKNKTLSDLDLKWTISSVENEILFTRKRASKSKLIYGETSVALAQYYELLGELSKAEKLYKEALTLFPGQIPFVQQYAMSLYQQKKYQLAINIIKTLEEHVIEASAEFNYFLGLAYLKLNNLEKAQHFADKAYSLGYPFTWLRDQLKNR